MNEVVPGRLERVNHKNKKWTDEEREVFYFELRFYGTNRGYKPGWAAIKYREKFGEWPNWEANGCLIVDRISRGTELWIRRKNREWAKSQPPRVVQPRLLTAQSYRDAKDGL